MTLNSQFSHHEFFLGIDLVQKAIELDNQHKYAEAVTLYDQAVMFLIEALKRKLIIFKWKSCSCSASNFLIINYELVIPLLNEISLILDETNPGTEAAVQSKIKEYQGRSNTLKTAVASSVPQPSLSAAALPPSGSAYGQPALNGAPQPV